MGCGTALNGADSRFLRAIKKRQGKSIYISYSAKKCAVTKLAQPGFPAARAMTFCPAQSSGFAECHPICKGGKPVAFKVLEHNK